MNQRFGKWTKYFGNFSDICSTAKVFEVRYKYVANDLAILNISSMCGKRLKYLRIGFNMLEKTKEFSTNMCHLPHI